MIFLLDEKNPQAPFPPVERAEREPNGLLAVGGDLRPERLLNAYRNGIFPWYSEQQPILWWSPDPRMLLFPGKIKLSRSLRKSLRNRPYQVTFDRAFTKVMQACAEPRATTDETWITAEMLSAYTHLHALGHAHSVEVWTQQKLVGGLYGVACGRVFFGESMFSRERDASKVALAHLCRLLARWEFRLIDCQVYSGHLLSLGAEQCSRAEFCQLLRRYRDAQAAPADWSDQNITEGW
ncbi:MAG: leucyl/phenylalanyl-tRNA--protein transferase [Gammaproteobacteria bacterium]|nr:leucyl/phenylalanyl-tRNA--protein transferase [Gammaproteobacteria bacterium]